MYGLRLYEDVMVHLRRGSISFLAMITEISPEGILLLNYENEEEKFYPWHRVHVS